MLAQNSQQDDYFDIGEDVLLIYDIYYINISEK